MTSGTEESKSDMVNAGSFISDNAEKRRGSQRKLSTLEPEKTSVSQRKKSDAKVDYL